MNKMEIKISAMVENEALVRTAISAFALNINPTLDEISDLKTIVSEAVSNAIIHGYNKDSTKDVYIKAVIENQEIRITINDYGIGIKDLKSALNPHFSSKQDEEHAGMGFSIIKALSDDFSIRSEENIGTRVYIVKKFKKHYQKV
ncbi:MAG: anti-sigma F factor [Bacilli bacterium]|nr:anti-sigma F factor [Bacilli bacterium]